MSAETGPTRRWWMLFPPQGLTSEIIIAEARKLKLIADVSFGDRTIELSVIMAGMRESDWLALRKACFAQVGINDPEQWERERITGSPMYTRWKGNLVQHQREAQRQFSERM